MLHLLKYQFLQTIRSRSIMFWALAFPLILGTLFYVSFGNTGLAGTGETDWEPVPVAIVMLLFLPTRLYRIFSRYHSRWKNGRRTNRIEAGNSAKCFSSL